MNFDLLQISIGVGIGLILGVLLMLLLNKLKSGSASPAAVKAEFDDYKNEVEAHFEATSKKFKQMTEQYQDLYEHLSVGATSLCRPGSVAAALADQSNSDSVPKKIAAEEADVSKTDSLKSATDTQDLEGHAARKTEELEQEDGLDTVASEDNETKDSASPENRDDEQSDPEVQSTSKTDKSKPKQEPTE